MNLMQEVLKEKKDLLFMLKKESEKIADFINIVDCINLYFSLKMKE